MTQDELFPETRPPEPEMPAWPGYPTLVATATVKHGGTCFHCGGRLGRGRTIDKLAPACCPNHLTRPRDVVNGPGKWVCRLCTEKLVPQQGDPE